jgi:hypothetical protein
MIFNDFLMIFQRLFNDFLNALLKAFLNALLKIFFEFFGKPY